MNEQESAQEGFEDRPLDGEPPPDMPPPPAETPPPIPRSKLIWQFVGGFLGWFLVNGAFYWITYGGMNQTTQPSGLLCVILPANIIAFVILIAIKKTRQVGWGMLSAIGLNMLISIMIGSILNAMCLVPFYFPPIY